MKYKVITKPDMVHRQEHPLTLEIWLEDRLLNDGVDLMAKLEGTDNAYVIARLVNGRLELQPGISQTLGLKLDPAGHIDFRVLWP